MYFWNSTVRLLALSLCILVPASQTALADPKPLTPDQAHAKIQKAGVDNWVIIHELNGVQLHGRILSLDNEAFTLQTSNAPQTATIAYQDVVYIQGPPSAKTTWILVGAFVGAAVISGFLIHHAYENSLANQKASQASFCQANNIPLSQCPGA